MALAVWFVVRRDWGVYALIFTLPFEFIGSWALHPDTGHPVVRLSQVVGAALILATLVNVARGKVRLRLPRGPLWLLLLFVGWCGVSLLHGFHAQLINGYVAMGFVATLVYTLYLLVPDVSLRKLQAVLMASAGLVAVFGLYQFVAGSLGVDSAYTGLREAYSRQVFGFPRVQSTALEPLYFADYLLIPLLVGISLLLFAPQTFPRWQRLSLFVMGLSFVLTMSRGAFIGAAGGLLVMAGLAWLQREKIVLSGPTMRRSLVGGVAALVLGMSLVGAATVVSSGSLLKGPIQFIEQATTKLTRTGSFTERGQMRDRAVAIIRAQPVFGVGIEGITPYLRGYPTLRSENDVIALNNQFLELIAEAGIVGAAMFYGFLVWLLVAASGSIRRLKLQNQAWVLGLIGAVIAITVQAQSFSGFLLTHVWVAYGLLAGLGLVYIDKHKPQKNI
jgi:O-antigen ligase